MMESSIWISLLVLVLTIFVVMGWLNSRNLPPGPLGWPILGYLPHLKTTHEDFYRLSKKYGDVFSFRTVGGTLIIVLSGSKTIKNILVNRADEFVGRPLQENLISWVSDGLGISQEEGQTWNDHRRFFHQTARRLGVGRSDIENRVKEEVGRLIQAFRNMSGRPADAHLHIAHAVGSVASHLLFGKGLPDKGPEFQNLLDIMVKVVFIFVGTLHMVVGFPFRILMTLHPQLRQVAVERDAVRKFSDDLVDEQVKSFEFGRIRGYVDAYLEHRHELQQKRELQGSSFTLDRLKANTVNLLFEGTETTCFTVLSLLLELSKHPDVQLQAQKELDAVIGRERLPSWADRTDLLYLDATVLELYRTASQILVSTMYSNFEETTIGHYRIPRRSILVANLWSINFDPEIYPNPHIFDPSRFLKDDGKRMRKEGPYPFGIGKRSCVGEALAQVEIFLIISSILQTFTVYPAKEVEYDIILKLRY